MPISEDIIENSKILGNAFDIYTEKWELIICKDKEELFTIIGKSNQKLFKLLSKNIPQRKNAGFFQTFTGNGNLGSDIVFIKFIKDIKKLAYESAGNNIISSENYMKTLRKTIDNIENITAVPKTMIISKEGYEWCMKLSDILNHVNDRINECFGSISILENVFEIDIKPKILINLRKESYAINAIGSSRFSTRKIERLPNKFIVKDSFNIINGIFLITNSKTFII